MLDGEEHPVIEFLHIEKDKGDIKDIRLYETKKVQRIRLEGRVLDVADDVLNNVGTFILLQHKDDVSLHILRHGQLKEITCMHGSHGQDEA